MEESPELDLEAGNKEKEDEQSIQDDGSDDSSLPDENLSKSTPKVETVKPKAFTDVIQPIALSQIFFMDL